MRNLASKLALGIITSVVLASNAFAGAVPAPVSEPGTLGLLVGAVAVVVIARRLMKK